MDLTKMTLEETVLYYGTFVKENIANFSNDLLTTIMNQSNTIQTESIKQYHKNLDLEKKTNLAILDSSQQALEKYTRLSEKMNLDSEKHLNDDLITLNVGGKLFTTFKRTLMRFDDCYFYGLLNSGRFLPDPDGSYFIDRSPAHFELIMDYLRKGELCTKGLNDHEVENLEEELDYYLLRIKDLKPLFQWNLSPTKKPINATFSDHNQIVTKTSGIASYNCPVIGTEPVPEFTIQLISGKDVAIGFIPLEQFVQNECHFYIVKDYCYFCCSGCVYYNRGQYKRYGSRLNIGDRLTAMVNGSSIRFLKNGKDLGEAINSSKGKLYPVVELYQIGDSVMIVPNP
jgi:hypothetical protein